MISLLMVVLGEIGLTQVNAFYPFRIEQLLSIRHKDRPDPMLNNVIYF